MANVLFSEGSSPVWFECQSGDKWSLDPNPREYYACSILDYSFSLLENIDGIALYPHPDGTSQVPQPSCFPKPGGDPVSTTILIGDHFLSLQQF